MSPLFYIILLFHTMALARWPFALFETKKPFCIVLEASGDALNPGRTIFTNFENAVSFTLTRQIKEVVEAYTPSKIYINRTPTEVIQPFQNAQFTNKLHADLYISIHCYQQQKNHAPTITLYQYSYREPTIIKKDSLGFYSYDQSYMLNEAQTTQWAQELKKLIASQNQIEINGVYKLPFKPLMGVQANSIGIEIGIDEQANLSQIAYVIGSALQQFIGQQ